MIPPIPILIAFAIYFVIAMTIKSHFEKKNARIQNIEKLELEIFPEWFEGDYPRKPWSELEVR